MRTTLPSKLTSARAPALSAALAALAALVTLASAVVPAPARAASDPVLAVLYVDNHSGDATYDVLEKGLADMLVTDLIAQGLTVVERTRLQALLDEQALQKSAFFDKTTAVKVGRGLGATHVVIGALAAMKPLISEQSEGRGELSVKIRLDLHLVEVESGAVVVAAKVDGPDTALFDLEQSLVAKFVEAFSRRFAKAPSPQTKVRDLAALLEYSQALDLADRGELEAAQKKIEETIRRSPSFGLARKRREELLLRIAGSRDRREALIAAEHEALVKAARAALANKTSDATVRLAWRDLERQLLGGVVAKLLSATPFGVAALGQEKALRAALVAYAECTVDYLAELDAIVKAPPTSWWSARLPEADEARARTLGYDTSPVIEPSEAWLRHARFLMMGELEAPRPLGRIVVGPPLGNLDATWDKRGWDAYGEAVTRASGSANAAIRDMLAIRALEAWGDALVLRGRSDDGIAKWQEVLDRYPGSSQFEGVERNIKRVLGVEPDNDQSNLEAWQRGLDTCHDMSLRVGLDAVTWRRTRMRGLQGLADTVAEVEKACLGKPKTESIFAYLYSHVALAYGKHLRCTEFEALMAKSIASGGSRGDVEGWRKNWTKCPLP